MVVVLDGCMLLYPSMDVLSLPTPHELEYPHIRKKISKEGIQPVRAVCHIIKMDFVLRNSNLAKPLKSGLFFETLRVET